MPELPSFAQYYTNITACWHSYSFIRASGPELLLALIGLFNATNLPDHCFLVGRIPGLSDSAERVITAMLCFFHLSWRGSQHLLNRPYNVSNVFLMFESETVIEQFLEAHMKPCGECRPAECTNPNHDMELGLPNWGELDARQRYMTEMLCFKSFQFISGSRKLATNYYLRPNRTKAARFHLRNNIGLISVLNAAFCVSVLLITASFATWVLALDSQYIKRYPGCSPDLEFSNNHTTGWY